MVIGPAVRHLVEVLENRVLVVDVQHHCSRALESGRDHIEILMISLHHPSTDGLLSRSA